VTAVRGRATVVRFASATLRFAPGSVPLRSKTINLDIESITR
jgi:hypothetical protein